MSTKIPREEWATPNTLGRLRSRLAGNPTGLLGRLIGRAMVKDTWAANARCLEILGDVDGETVLDLGYGQGRMVRALSEAGARVLGVDVSETMRAQATAANRSLVESGRVDLRVGDGVHLPFAEHAVNAVTTAHTLYFMPDPETTLAEVRRVLVPGGRLVLAFSSADSGVPAWMDPAVYRMYTTDEVVELVTASGLSNIQVESDQTSGKDMRWITAVAKPVG